jgi:chromosome partitioning protein
MGRDGGAPLPAAARRRHRDRYGLSVILVVAALKGGVGKTTSSVYLAAVASDARHVVTLIDADPQASAAEWIETRAEDEWLAALGLVEAPTERLLAKALAQIPADEVAIVDTPPGQERMLERALELADVTVIPTRVGGVETARAEAVLDLVPRKLPAGLVITSARTFTRDFVDAVDGWSEASVPVWGTVPERVGIASGPASSLSPDGVDAYRGVWRRALRAARGS